jgi:hypothetical protein
MNLKDFYINISIDEILLDCECIRQIEHSNNINLK